MWGNKNPEQKGNAPVKAPEPVAAVPAKPPVAATPIPAPSPVAATPAVAPVPSAPILSSPVPSVASQMNATASRIGPGLKIHGVISGESDLIVEGETNGKIYLSSSRVTVAKSGKVQADIEGLEINIEGSVQGNLKASDRIRLGAASNVQGSMMTPRIAIEDGARLRGKVEMTRAGEPKAAEKPASVAAPVKVEAQAAPKTESKIEPKIEAKSEQKIEQKAAETKPAPDAKPGAVIGSATSAPADAALRAAAARTQGD